MLEKTPESPLDSKEIKQLILKEINPEYSLEGLMLKLQYFDHLMQRSCCKDPPAKILIGKDSDAGRDWGQEEKGTTED